MNLGITDQQKNSITSPLEDSLYQQTIDGAIKDNCQIYIKTKMLKIK